jgi:hypothetical protein
MKGGADLIIRPPALDLKPVAGVAGDGLEDIAKGFIPDRQIDQRFRRGFLCRDPLNGESAKG